MRVFIGWSGERSRQVSEALRRWLPQMLQAAEPWTTSVDLVAGSSWVRQIEYELRETRAGIVCLTPENLQAPWMHLETGTLWARGSVVIPYLLDFAPAELNGPLARFQAVRAEQDGTWQLVRTLNRLLHEYAVPEAVLLNAFELGWPKLKSEIDVILRTRAPASRRSTRRRSGLKTRTERQLLEEIVRTVSTPPQHVASETTKTPDRGFVFIVHGRNQGVKETVARFVEMLGLKAVVLHEQPDQGRTVIEKFEAATSSASYAIGLFTGDDRGGPKAQPYKRQQARARQNVVLELGFFMAQLGRNRVTVIQESGVEIPSDYRGVLFLPLDDAGAWRFLLARELRAAGLEIDLNKVS